MKLHKDFREFIELLNKNEVKYLIIGGYAVAFHGYVRSTGDLDIWIKISPKNAQRVLKTLKDFGFGSLDIDTSDFQKEYAIIQLGFPPYRIDIITTPDGISFDECYENKVVSNDNNIPLNFIDIENLKKNKKSSGRLRDLLDLDNL